MRRERLARWCLAGAAALVLIGAAIYLIGGFRVRLPGLSFSARHFERPLLVAAALVIAASFAHRETVTGSARRATDTILATVDRLADAVSRPAWGVAWGLAAAMLVFALARGSRAASGSDASGYVSQAALWARGAVVQTVPLAEAVPWPHATTMLAPLGYRGAPRGAKIVPTYPAGLPLLMALFRIVGGPQAVFFVVPLCAAALMLVVYGLGLRLGSPLSALGATALTATSPAMLMMALWPMSDVPATVFWLGALLLALGTHPPRPLATGIVTGIAILIRPNLAPLGAIPLAMLAWRAGTARRSPRVVVRAAIPIAAAAAALAALNAQLYGGPLKVGYGDGNAAGLYALGHVVPNLRAYGTWLWESQGIIAAVGVLALAARLLRRSSDRLPAIFAALVVASYLPYLVFDDWWYLRFLLPALPLLFLFATDIVAGAAARAGRRAQAAVTAAVILAASVHGLAFAAHRDVFTTASQERRYIDVGRFVRRDLPRGAVMIAMQHSGSLRYYAGSTTLRYELVAPDRMDEYVALLRRLSAGPFLVLDDWEEPFFRQRYASSQVVERMDSQLFARLDSIPGVRIYDLSGQAVPAVPRSIPHVAPGDSPGRFDE